MSNAFAIPLTTPAVIIFIILSCVHGRSLLFLAISFASNGSAIGVSGDKRRIKFSNAPISDRISAFRSVKAFLIPPLDLVLPDQKFYDWQGRAPLLIQS
ncbi:hypothetical protein AYB34_14020 [Leptospira sp. ZV016]|nr:hypothetical protein AYB32_13645 [Leptospira kirschneri]KXZ32284.1 hypothetical protein AYB34_14020 [Leptospira sp. ZV016]